MKIKTDLLKSILSKSSKGAGNGSVPITQFVSLSLKSNVLTVTTTDINNYLQIIEKVTGDDEEITLPLEQFSKLVNKTSVDEIELTPKTDHVLVKGNGEYQIKISFDSSGNKLNIVMPAVDESKITPVVVKTDDLKSVLKVNKSCVVANGDNSDCYTGYYFDTDDVYSTDTNKLCKNHKKILGNQQAVMFSHQLVDLFDVITEDNINLYVDNGTYWFKTGNCVIYGKSRPDIADFQIDVVSPFFNIQYDSNCKISKSKICEVLDRMSLFTSNFEKNQVNFNFTKNGLNIKSKSGNGDETIPYSSSTIQDEFSCVIDMTRIKSQLDSLSDDEIEIKFGGTSDEAKSAITITSKDVVFVCSLIV